MILECFLTKKRDVKPICKYTLATGKSKKQKVRLEACFSVKRVKNHTIWRELAKTTRERVVSKEFWIRSLLSLQRNARMCDVIFFEKFFENKEKPKNNC